MFSALCSQLFAPTSARILQALLLAGAGVAVILNTPATWQRHTTSTESVVLHRTQDDVFVPADRLPLQGTEVWTFGVKLEYERSLLTERHAAEVIPAYRTAWDDRRLALTEPGDAHEQVMMQANAALVRLRGGLWGPQFSRVIESQSGEIVEHSLVGVAVMSSRYAAFGLVMVSMLAAAGLVSRRAAVNARIKAYARGKCPRCRYSLQAIEQDRCPECGRVPSTEALQALRLIGKYPKKCAANARPVGDDDERIGLVRRTPMARNAQNALRSLADGMPS